MEVNIKYDVKLIDFNLPYIKYLELVTILNNKQYTNLLNFIIENHNIIEKEFRCNKVDVMFLLKENIFKYEEQENQNYNGAMLYLDNTSLAIYLFDKYIYNERNIYE